MIQQHALKRYILYLLIILTITSDLSVKSIAEGLGQQECDSLAIAAASFMNNRSNGVSKQSLLSALPSLEQPPFKKQSAKYLLLTEMHQMVQEIFAHDSIDQTVYMVFKSETCIRKMQGQKVISYELAHPELQRCSELSSHQEQVKCSTKAAD